MIIFQDTFLFDHRVIYAEAFIPVHVPNTVKIDQNLNTASTCIEILDFNQSYWVKLKESLNTIDWSTRFCGISVSLYLDVTMLLFATTRSVVKSVKVPVVEVAKRTN